MRRRRTDCRPWSGAYLPEHSNTTLIHTTLMLTGCRAAPRNTPSSMVSPTHPSAALSLYSVRIQKSALALEKGMLFFFIVAFSSGWFEAGGASDLSKCAFSSKADNASSCTSSYSIYCCSVHVVTARGLLTPPLLHRDATRR